MREPIGCLRPRMSDITTTEIVFAAVGASATIIGGIWAAWTYFDSRAAKSREDARAAREEARAALAAEKEAWKELSGFHKLTVDVLVAAVLLRKEANDHLAKEFQARHSKWQTLFAEKLGLLGPKGKERAASIAQELTAIGLHHMRLRTGLPLTATLTRMMPENELLTLCGRINADATYFIR